MYILQKKKKDKTKEIFPDISENRKYKTLNSIPIDNDEFKVLKSYIDLENLFFSQNSKNQIDFLFNAIISFLNQNNENKQYRVKYVIDLLLYFILVRIKKREIAGYLLSQFLLSNTGIEPKFIKDSITKNKIYQKNSNLLSILYFHGIIRHKPPKEKDPFFYNNSDSTSSNLEYLLSEDKITDLQDLFNSYGDKMKTFQFQIKQKSRFYVAIILSVTNGRFEQVSLLDFCSFYGSVECFKFLQMNKFQYGSHINEMAIAGGNFEIIHELERNGISFDHCFKLSIKFHHHLVSDWLLSNYKCELFSIEKCLKYMDYHAFLYFFLNGAFKDIYQLFIWASNQKIINNDFLKFLINNCNNINDYFSIKIEASDSEQIYKYTILGFLIKQTGISLDVFKLLFDKKCDVNMTFTTHILSSCKIMNSVSKYTPLGYLCTQKYINKELFKLLLDQNADVNTQIIHLNEHITPLGSLCNSIDADIQLIKLLLDKGADPNQGTAFTSPLFFLCKNYFLNLEAIKLLIDSGADINAGINTKSYTPLECLCLKQNITNEIIQFFIDEGANASQGSEYSSPLGCLLQSKVNNIELFKTLINNGADVNKEFQIKHKGNKYTPLFYMCQQKDVNIETIKFLIDNGADVNKGSDFTSPLSFLCQQPEQNMTLIKLLLDRGADVNSGNRYSTPLAFVCQQEKINVELFKLLLDEGALVNKGFITPLFAICKQKQVNYDLVKMLFDKGADANRKCNSCSPLYNLCDHDEVNIEVVKLFIDKGVILDDQTRYIIKSKKNQQLMSLFNIK